MVYVRQVSVFFGTAPRIHKQFSVSSSNDNAVNTDSVKDLMEMSLKNIYFGKHYVVSCQKVVVMSFIQFTQLQ